jgi:hypothetical protein
MNKMLLGLTAVFALSVAVPAYANDEKKEEKKEEKAPAKKGGKKEKKEEKKAE